MNTSLHNLQLNMEQTTLSHAQQDQLIKVIGKLLRSNFDPHFGSILIVRAWADGTFEEILSGNLAYGEAADCHTQKLQQRSHSEPRWVNDSRLGSAAYVGHEVSEALNCCDPESFYYGRLDVDTGSFYAGCGHYVLSLPIDDGRIIASFRASYCWRGNRISVSVSELWQNELMLVSLAEALHAIMPQDERLTKSLDEVTAHYHPWETTSYGTNKALITRCLTNERLLIYSISNLANSKAPAFYQAYA